MGKWPPIGFIVAAQRNAKLPGKLFLRPIGGHPICCGFGVYGQGVSALSSARAVTDGDEPAVGWVHFAGGTCEERVQTPTMTIFTEVNQTRKMAPKWP
jgi:hypothetical protein